MLGGLPIAELCHGGAQGADVNAGAWAWSRNIPVTVFEAHWDLEGAAAGPKRNARMLREFGPDLVVAFPGGIGTMDMCRRAAAAGVRLLTVQ